MQRHNVGVVGWLIVLALGVGFILYGAGKHGTPSLGPTLERVVLGLALACGVAFVRNRWR